ncbi:MAG: hypothetical protein M3R70_07545 [Actinomycetota bacterium]|nr:hypothetical protein [Actinomycetota bacterium]
MKNFAVLLVLALLAVGVPFAQSAGKGPVNRRLLKLERQVRVLKADLKTTKARIFCFRLAAPLSDYGDRTTNKFGYWYSNDGKTFFYSSALDFSSPDLKPDIYAAAVDPKCIPKKTAVRGNGKVPLLRIR